MTDFTPAELIIAFNIIFRALGIPEVSTDQERQATEDNLSSNLLWQLHDIWELASKRQESYFWGGIDLDFAERCRILHEAARHITEPVLHDHS